MFQICQKFKRGLVLAIVSNVKKENLLKYSEMYPKIYKMIVNKNCVCYLFSRRFILM